MKKKIIVAVALLSAIIIIFILGFVAGGTRQVRVSVDSDILFDVVVLRFLDAGKTDHARSVLETKLISQLDWHDALSNRYLHIGSALLRGQSGAVWKEYLQWATDRVKTRRDEYHFFVSHPEAAKEQIGKSFQDLFRDPLENLGFSSGGVLVDSNPGGGITVTFKEAVALTEAEKQCRSNLRLMCDAKDLVAEQQGYKKGDEIPEEQVSSFFRGGLSSLMCPAGGEYLLRPYGDNPECAEHGPLLGERTRPMAIEQKQNDGNAQHGAEDDAEDRAP